MAEVTLAALEALNVKPVMSPTAASRVAGFLRISTVEGPLRVEYNWYQQGSGDTFASSDTFTTQIQSPLFATAQGVSLVDSVGLPTSAEVETRSSSSDYGTVTIRGWDSQTSLGVLVTVYGF